MTPKKETAMATNKKSTAKKSTAKKSPKRLVKGKDKMLFGVCSGIGQYFGLDATIVRLLWILITAFTGFFPGIILYILSALVIPEE